MNKEKDGGNSVKKRYEWKREHVGESGPLSAACGAKKGHNSDRLPAWAKLSLRETEIPQSSYAQWVPPLFYRFYRILPVSSLCL